jgi:hypothetical protein
MMTSEVSDGKAFQSGLHCPPFNALFLIACATSKLLQ